MNLYKYHSKPETLDHYDEAFERVPALVWEKYWHDPVQQKKREKVLAKDPKIAHLYAALVLKGPFPAGEAAIAKHSKYAYDYAFYILKKPWPAGEAAIAKHPLYAYYYGLGVLKNPFTSPLEKHVT